MGKLALDESWTLGSAVDMHRDCWQVSRCGDKNCAHFHCFYFLSKRGNKVSDEHSGGAREIDVGCLRTGKKV